MNKLKKILVATDFSTSSEFAMMRAMELAKSCQSKVTLLHVVEKKKLDETLDRYLGKFLPKSLWLNTKEYYLNLLQDKIDSYVKLNLNIEKIVIPDGKPSKKILAYAKKNGYDLLVIGAHGRYSIHDFFVGTTAEYIAEKTKCSVLIVKNKLGQPYKKILAPIDFNRTSKSALNVALQLFPKAAIELLYVGDYEFEELLSSEEAEENLSKAKLSKIKKALQFYLNDKMKKFLKYLRKKQHQITFSIKLGFPAPIIIKMAEKTDKDLIVMGTQGHSKKHYLFMGRVSHAVVLESKKDILLVPPPG